jgi:YVTN family beta-propeller protein
VAVNPVTNRIYVPNSGDGTVTVIDGATNDTALVPAGNQPNAVAVNPVTNRIYVPNSGDSTVTVIDGATNDTALVPAGNEPYAVAVNPVTNKIYVTNHLSDDVTVIDGATNGTTTVPAGDYPFGVAVNPVTNKVYVMNGGSNNVTVIDGATNDTALVPVGLEPLYAAVDLATNKVYVSCNDGRTVTIIDGLTSDTTTIPADASTRSLVVNPVLNKVYVAMSNDTVLVIDGATNSTNTVAVGNNPHALALNPVTNRVYVANYDGDNVTVIDEAPFNDTKVRVAMNLVPGCTTSLARPELSGKGVNRWTPRRTTMMGVLNRVGAGQVAWDWAAVTSGAGTDSITWEYSWGGDSLIMGENLVCVVPLEAQAAVANNLGLGTPFAGNLEVYPVYRMESHGGAEERTSAERRMANEPTIVRGMLFLPERPSPSTSCLVDASGRQVMELCSGANDVRALAPGVYFVTERPQAVRKIVLTE